ncbi:MAG: rRNA maturation RNAse YbeY [Acidimicrobiales bacterium]
MHGILHLLGLDHHDEAERLAMQARERELLLQFHGTPARDPWMS